jgi:hypothetical protein
MVAALLCLLAGWFRYPWWSPAAIIPAFSPLTLVRFVSVNSWRVEAGLPTHDLGYMILGTLFDLAIQFGAYWLGRGAARVWKRPRQVSN